MLTIKEMMDKSPLSSDEDKLLFYSAAALSVLGMVTTVLWKAYKLCGGKKRYVVNHGFTEVVVVESTKPKTVERSETADRREVQVGHEISQL